jgi:hypothetical protein
MYGLILPRFLIDPWLGLSSIGETMLGTMAAEAVQADHIPNVACWMILTASALN